jgi:enoyl-CoA hydratase/carnithine racemase
MFELSVESGFARLVIDRPEARNAIPANRWIPLAEQAEQAVAAGARLLVLEGRGGAFSAGADLGDFPAFMDDPEAAAGFRTAMRAGLERIAGLPVPTIARIDGPCFGAGVALAMACDLRSAGPDAVFAITPARYGISYPQEDVARLVALVGPGQAARLLLGAGTVDASEAVRIGLADLGPEDETGPLIEAILANSDESLAVLKRGIRLAAAGASRDREQDLAFDRLFASPGFAERLARLRPSRR